MVIDSSDTSGPLSDETVEKEMSLLLDLERLFLFEFISDIILDLSLWLLDLSLWLQGICSVLIVLLI